MQHFIQIIRGIGSVIDLWPELPERRQISIPRKTDEEAIRSDWERVGEDLKSAIQKQREDVEEKQASQAAI